MQVLVGQTFTATHAAPAAVGDLGARIEAPVTRAVVSAWTRATFDATTGLWAVVLDPPPDLGSYLLVWRTGDPEPPDYEVFIPLDVVDPLTIPPAGGDFTPTVQEVAYVTPAYTRGGFDDDTPQSGAEQGTYTDTTSPTADQVQGLIAAAVQEVQGRVGVAIPNAHLGLARRAAVWHVAATIAAQKVPAGVDESGSEYRAFLTNYTACLTELQSLAREPNAMRLT